MGAFKWVQDLRWSDFFGGIYLMLFNIQRRLTKIEVLNGIKREGK